MTEYLLDNPLLLLFVVVAIGYPLGRLKFRGSSLGVASVLFAGLAIGAIDQDLRLPPILYQLGLVLFVYTIGLSNGRAFFSSLRRKGARDALLVAGVVTLGALLTAGLFRLLDLKPALAAGMFAGGMTNTPALAAQLEYLQNSGDGTLQELLAQPVVGYSVAYPIGVLGVIVAIGFAQRVWRIDYRLEAQKSEAASESPAPLENVTIRVTSSAAASLPIRDLVEARGWKVVFGRVQRAGRLSIAGGDTTLEPGDLVSVIGASPDVTAVVAALGEAVDEPLELDRSELDFRRIFVSAPAVTGRRLSELNLTQRFGAIVTRIRRGDIEFLPTGRTVLEPGDRVRVVAPRQSLPAVTRFLGDSYRALSEVDVLTFSLGLALGLLLGTVPIPLPGGIDLELGAAGGPLVVALILGALDRTGPLEWSLSYSANLTIRQFGLILFLAGVGTQAGNAFISTVPTREGLSLLAGGAVITMLTALASLWIGHRLLKIPMGLLAGMVAGIQTQPAALGFALEQSQDELPNIGYAAVFPIATITKIIAGQLIVAMLI
jgi:putative transport protein